jgi:hypothetical protein
MHEFSSRQSSFNVLAGAAIPCPADATKDVATHIATPSSGNFPFRSLRGFNCPTNHDLMARPRTSHAQLQTPRARRQITPDGMGFQARQSPKLDVDSHNDWRLFVLCCRLVGRWPTFFGCIRRGDRLLLASERDLGTFASCEGFDAFAANTIEAPCKWTVSSLLLPK